MSGALRNAPQHVPERSSTRHGALLNTLKTLTFVIFEISDQKYQKTKPIYYSARRAWRILSRVAPSLNLDPALGYNKLEPTYPFSVIPDQTFSIQQVFDLYRDHYEGTPYDLTTGVSAGPFANPSRWAGVVQPKGAVEGKDDSIPYGAWERSISIYRTVYAHIAASKVTETGQRQQVLWFGPGRSSSTVFVPMRIAGATRSAPALLAGTMLAVEQKSLWWAVNAVANWADLR